MKKNPIQMIKDCQESGEPFFVIRAKDKCSLAALGSYNTASHLLDVNDEQLQETQKFFRDFVKWQGDNKDKVKIPD